MQRSVALGFVTLKSSRGIKPTTMELARFQNKTRRCKQHSFSAFQSISRTRANCKQGFQFAYLNNCIFFTLTVQITFKTTQEPFQAVALPFLNTMSRNSFQRSLVLILQRICHMGLLNTKEDNLKFILPSNYQLIIDITCKCLSPYQ